MLYIIGAGGHAKVVADTARLLNMSYRFLAQEADDGAEIMLEGHWLRDADILALNHPCHLICGLGSAGKVQNKKEALYKFANWDLLFKTLVHPSAVLGGDTQVGRGVYIAQGAQVTRGAKIHDHVLINTAAVVDHDSEVGIGSHIASGAVLCGGVTCGPWVHVGAGSVIIQGCHIAEGVVLGAGAVVTKDITQPYTTWVGAPARRI